MKKMPDFLLGALGVFGRDLINVWMSTLDYQVAYYDPGIDPHFRRPPQSALHLLARVYPLLHFPAPSQDCRCSYRNIVTPTSSKSRSPHRVRNKARFNPPWGCRSNSRNDERTAREPTPDDYPRRAARAAPRDGAGIRLSGFEVTDPDHRGRDRLRTPLPPTDMGYVCDPRPWSRARTISSPEIFVPPTSPKRESIITKKTETLLNRLTADAEDWAEKGYALAGACSIQPGPKTDSLFAKRRAAEQACPQMGKVSTETPYHSMKILSPPRFPLSIPAITSFISSTVSEKGIGRTPVRRYSINAHCRSRNEL